MKNRQWSISFQNWHIKVSGFPASWSQWSLTQLTSLLINFMTLYDWPSVNALNYILTINRERLWKSSTSKAPFSSLGRCPVTWPNYQQTCKAHGPYAQLSIPVESYNFFPSLWGTLSYMTSFVQFSLNTGPGTSNMILIWTIQSFRIYQGLELAMRCVLFN